MYAGLLRTTLVRLKVGVAEVRVGELGVVGELRGWFLLESFSFLLAALCSVAGLMWTEE